MDLSNNHLSGSIPILTNFSSLKSLRLYKNQLSGTIPESIWQMSNMENIYLGMNALEGVITESHFPQLSRLRSLGLSFNSLVLNFHSNCIPPFQLSFIRLSSCKMGPYFSIWLPSHNGYSYLRISNAGIVDIFSN